MKTLTEQLKSRQERIASLGGEVPKVGSLERQLVECDAEIARLTRHPAKNKLIESYRAMGMSEAEARVAAGVDRAVSSGDVNRAFKAGRMFESALLMGFSEAEAVVFANPALTREEAFERSTEHYREHGAREEAEREASKQAPSEGLLKEAWKI